MAENSKIEWTDHTFNPWIGCQKVSPGCDNCYAEALMDKRYGKVEWGPHGDRKRTSEANWKLPLRWDKQAAVAGKRAKVFCASLADWLDNKAPYEWRLDLAMLVEATPNLDWLLLTKRIENWGRQSPWRGSDMPLNVWLGVTCEDQAHYDRRWPLLREIPARIRFVSYEPAIGPLSNLREAEGTAPDWLICGGESGPQARHMEPIWARAVHEACAVSGTAFFMKQMTGKKPIPDDLMIRQFPEVWT